MMTAPRIAGLVREPSPVTFRLFCDKQSPATPPTTARFRRGTTT